MLEAFTVGVRVRLLDGVSAGLGLMSRGFLRAQGDADALQRKLGFVQKTMLVGGGLMAASGSIFWLIDKTLPAAKEYANQLSLMNTLGLKQADVAKAVGAAWSTSYAVPTSSAIQNMEMFRELRSAFGAGHEGEAAATMPTVAKIQGILTALTGREQEHVGFDVVKAIELRTGVMSQASLTKNSDQIAKMLLGMGGTITVSDLHGALKQGKIATQKWDDTFTYGYLPTFMQEVKTGKGGAQSAGTMLMTLYQQAHGRMLKSAIPLWEMGGLVKPRDVVQNSTGQFQIKPGGVAGMNVLERDPFMWVQSFLRPAVGKIMAREHLSAETAINAMFSNRNAAFAAYTMYQKAAQFIRDKKNIDMADGLGGYQKLLRTNPELAQMALQKQWNNILAQLGYSIMPDLLKAAQLLMPYLKQFSKWLGDNPERVRQVVRDLGLFGLALGGLGTATLVAGGLQSLGWILGGLGKAGIGLATKIGLLQTAAQGAEVAIGAQGGAGLVGALWRARAGILGLGIAAAGIYWMATHPIGGEFEKGHDGDLTHWKPNWRKDSWWDRPITEIFSGPGKKQAPQGQTSPADMASAIKSALNGVAVKMDGKTVGRIVTGHQGADAARPATGATSFDPSWAPLRPNMLLGGG